MQFLCLYVRPPTKIEGEGGNVCTTSFYWGLELFLSMFGMTVKTSSQTSDRCMLDFFPRPPYSRTFFSSRMLRSLVSIPFFLANFELTLMSDFKFTYFKQKYYFGNFFALVLLRYLLLSCIYRLLSIIFYLFLFLVCIGNNAICLLRISPNYI